MAHIYKHSFLYVWAWFITLLVPKKKLAYLENLGELEFSRNSSTELEKRFGFVKIVHKKNSNFGLTLRKRRFCDAKQPLLPCKTYAFGMQNNRFWKVLIINELRNRNVCEKCLHTFPFSLLYRKAYCKVFVKTFRLCFCHVNFNVYLCRSGLKRK